MQTQQRKAPNAERSLSFNVSQRFESEALVSSFFAFLHAKLGTGTNLKSPLQKNNFTALLVDPSTPWF